MTNTPTTLEAIDAEALAGIVELACRAPSLHNSQPWRWVLEGTTLHLFADHTRFEHRTMSTDREVILSCGVVLDHLQVAAAAAGWATNVERFPDPEDHDDLASIAFHRAASVTDHDRALGQAISVRRTDRLAFAAPEPWIVLSHLLHSVIDGTVAKLDVIDDDGRPALADASRRSEAHRSGDETYQCEFGVVDRVFRTRRWHSLQRDGQRGRSRPRQCRAGFSCARHRHSPPADRPGPLEGACPVDL